MTDGLAYMKGHGNKELVSGLGAVLADTFVLYYKTHSFHWNVVGEHFRPLHTLFEEQYTALWQSTDGIAERIRQLDGAVPINLVSLMKQASLQETGQIPDALAMVQELANDNMAVVSHIYPVLEKADELGDQNTVDLLTTSLRQHEKAAWMLRSVLR